MSDSPFNSSESIGITSSTGTIGDIIKNLRVCVQDRVDETNGSLALCDTLLVDLDTVSHINKYFLQSTYQSQDRGEKWGCQTGSIVEVIV